MLKKIQQNLLLNHPLLWNTKVVPALLGAILINILFFCIGYSSAEIDFDYYYYTREVSSGFTYFGAVISGILFLIFWLISFSKNNAFKVFYPKTSKALYTEWILIFVITLSACLFPFSYNRGGAVKTRTYVSQEEMEKAVQILNLVDILIPESKTDYYKEYPDEEINRHAEKGFAKVPSQEFYVEDGDTIFTETVSEYGSYNIPSDTDPDVTFEGYPNFRQLSLLNYSSYDNIYIPYQYDFKLQNTDLVKEWLTNQDKEKVAQLMDDFLALHKKHGLRTNLTKEKWLELIYNPSKYPIGDFNLINRHDITTSSYNYSNSYYLQYEELSRGYTNIMRAYLDIDMATNLLLTTICIAITTSLLIFSFRVTSGKSWLIGLVSIGLILIINTFFAIISSFSGADNGLLLFIIILLILFIAELIYLINKVSTKKSKGKSHIIINHFVWFIPAIPVLIFVLIYIISDSTCYSYDNNYVSDSKYYDKSDCLYRYMEKHIAEFMWGNVCLIFVSMWFFIRFLLLKWKGLPEE